MSAISGDEAGRSCRRSGSGILGFGSMRITVVGELGASEALLIEEWVRWRLKFRNELNDLLVGDRVVVIVVILFDLAVVGEVVGLVAIVHMLLLRVLLPFEDAEDEPLVLVLIFRSLLKAPVLEIGGLDARLRGA